MTCVCGFSHNLTNWYFRDVWTEQNGGGAAKNIPDCIRSSFTPRQNPLSKANHTALNKWFNKHKWFGWVKITQSTLTDTGRLTQINQSLDKRTKKGHFLLWAAQTQLLDGALPNGAIQKQATPPRGQTGRQGCMKTTEPEEQQLQQGYSETTTQLRSCLRWVAPPLQQCTQWRLTD